jgi:hypothetical protein
MPIDPFYNIACLRLRYFHIVAESCIASLYFSPAVATLYLCIFTAPNEPSSYSARDLHMMKHNLKQRQHLPGAFAFPPDLRATDQEFSILKVKSDVEACCSDHFVETGCLRMALCDYCVLCPCRTARTGGWD